METLERARTVLGQTTQKAFIFERWTSGEDADSFEPRQVQWWQALTENRDAAVDAYKAWRKAHKDVTSPWVERMMQSHFNQKHVKAMSTIAQMLSIPKRQEGSAADGTRAGVPLQTLAI